MYTRSGQNRQLPTAFVFPRSLFIRVRSHATIASSWPTDRRRTVFENPRRLSMCYFTCYVVYIMYIVFLPTFEFSHTLSVLRLVKTFHVPRHNALFFIS